VEIGQATNYREMAIGLGCSKEKATFISSFDQRIGYRGNGGKGTTQPLLTCGESYT